MSEETKNIAQAKKVRLTGNRMKIAQKAAIEESSERGKVVSVTTLVNEILDAPLKKLVKKHKIKIDDDRA
jgi:hypothetical protein